MSKKRVFVIIHCCLTIAYLAWIGLHPYLKHEIVRKSEGALFESILSNQTLFQQLDEPTKEELIEGQQAWASNNQVPYSVYFSPPLFGLVWVALSLVILFLWWFEIKGAAPLTWLLPFIVIAHGLHVGSAPAAANPPFFPTQDELTPYLLKAEGKSRREQIISAWHLYLNDHWAPKSDLSFEERVEVGNFNFNIERIRWILAHGAGDATLATTLFTPSAFQFFFYLVWNGVFAWILNGRPKSQAPSPVS